MKLTHLNFETQDKLKLPGLLFEPEGKTGKVLISLHGNGNASIFYRPEGTNSMAKELEKIGVTYFPFNNRGAHYVTKFKWFENGVKKEIKYGTAYELIKECLLDIDAAIKFLESLGYKEFYLIGHSTGANKICVYDYFQKNNKVSKYILLGGGDDTGLYFADMGEEKFFAVLKRCQEEIKRGNGRKLAPKYITGSIMSYQSLYDTINPDGNYNTFPFNETINNLKLSLKELFREFKAIKKKTLVLYGQFDEYCYGSVEKCVEILRKQVAGKNNFNFQIIPGADHGVNEKEQELATLVAKWLKS
ncbi:DUF1749 domain-containing protein [Candidatus Gottesmanbacteria bacterium]|nr:DUF1749 domain-containing protein [Candidatus Gottesmanbacteria bacterium]